MLLHRASSLQRPVENICTNRSIGIDFVQEKFMGGGKQDDESAIEQAKDGQIADFIRGQYKGATGSDFPISNKNNNSN